MSEVSCHNQDLYHLSFDCTLQGVWQPRLPDGSQIKATSKQQVNGYCEPDLPRICFCPTVKQCFQAIYSNINHLFNKQQYPYLIFNLYKGQFTGTERILTSEYLTNNRLVWDAHVTNEHVSLDPVQMIDIGKVTVFNTMQSQDLNTNPFNDSNIDSVYVAPAQIQYQIHSNKLPRS